MPKFKYTAEFELNSPLKVLFPYFSTASGLEDWLADEVKVINEHEMKISWDDVERHAKIVSKRIQQNHCQIKFVIDDDEGQDGSPQSLEFKVDFNDMTSTCFISVTDYSDMDDEEELDFMWGQLMEALGEVTGSKLTGSKL